MYLCAVNNTLTVIMPRQERLQSATGIYHVMLRGINKQDIFEDDEDYLQFLNILRALVNRCDEQGHNLPPHCTFYAYCLMTNHVHLLVRERDEHIGESIKRIGVAYARYYNHKYERNGHLFQDRFLSEPVNSIEYFMTLMRYIHQNPVIAGLTDEVRAYPWSSWLDVDYGMGGTITDEELKEKMVEISGLLQPMEIQKLEKKNRNTILKQLCEYGANIRQISRITGISYGVIYRAKSGS